MLGDIIALEKKLAFMTYFVKETLLLSCLYPLSQKWKQIKQLKSASIRIQNLTNEFSRYSDAGKRWVLTSSYSTQSQKILYEFFNYTHQKFTHKDITTRKTSKFEFFVQAAPKIVSNVFINLLF